MTTAVIATLLREGGFELVIVPSGQDSDMYHGSSLSR